MKKTILSLLFIMLSSLLKTEAQYPPNYHYTLLDQGIVDELVNRSSGDLAIRHIIELAGYSRARESKEYYETLPESSYVLEQLAGYGIENADIERFGKVSTWQGIDGSLWEIRPGLSKIADFNDLPLMVASGSNPTDIEAQLVWVDNGSSVYLNEESIKGKIVLTSSSIRSIHSRAIRMGALGTVSFYSPRPLVDPVQIPSTGISGDGFGFVLPPREGHLLRDRLKRGEEIFVKATIESKREKLDLQIPYCLIEGTDEDAAEILITAHLFEGYVKMGANDNLSGSAVILEVANVLKQLIEEGILEQPKRNIRFLWVPEFSGTIPWVNANRSIIERTIFNLNLDMVGLNLRDNQSFLCLHKSGYSTASYVNDVVENFYRYVGETNRQGITDRLGRRGFAKRIVSLTGTDDPFYYRIMTLHGSSDNAVFNDANVGIPGLKMITWPDNYYHTSKDRPENCDPTQLRRAIFITAASVYTIASADAEMVSRIASEVSGLSSQRMGIQLSKAMDQLSKSDAGNIEQVYKRAVFCLEGVTLGEEASLIKMEELITDKSTLIFLNNQVKNIKRVSETHLLSLEQYMEQRCMIMGITPKKIVLDDLEQRASKMRSAHTPKMRSAGYAGLRQELRKLPQEVLSKYLYSNVVNTNEVAGLANGGHTVLEIKKMVDAQFETESPLLEIINFLKLMESAGFITL